MSERKLEQSQAAQTARNISIRPLIESDKAGVAAVIRRAQNELAVRDLMSFGFIHLPYSILRVLATVFKGNHPVRANADPEPKVG